MPPFPAFSTSKVLQGSRLEKQFRFGPNHTTVNIQIAEIYGCSSRIWQQVYWPIPKACIHLRCTPRQPKRSKNGWCVHVWTASWRAGLCFIGGLSRWSVDLWMRFERLQYTRCTPKDSWGLNLVYFTIHSLESSASAVNHVNVSSSWITTVTTHSRWLRPSHICCRL